jgi:hypothetical protein
MFKYLIKNLQDKGHTIKISINTKDILEELVRADGIDYENILPLRRKRNSKLAALLTLIKKDFKIFSLQMKGRYELMAGTESALAHIGWLFRKPVLIFDEDDVAIVPETSLISFPFATKIVSPFVCNLGKWTKKKIGYNGYQKTAYLHPDYFIPDEKIIRKDVARGQKYFLIRISGLTAYHDTGIKGFTIEIIRKIIGIIQPYGKVLLSTERQLPDDLQPLICNTEVNKIHHYLYFAEFIIADSQSMCVEAAILGTPSIRFSDFAGKISVLEELEHNYDLTYGIPVSEVDKLYTKINELLRISDLRQTWQKKRKKMLEDKIDVTSFWTWLIDQYPNSISLLNSNPEFQNNFKNPKNN